MPNTNPRRDRMVRFAAAAIALAVSSLGLSARSAEILLLDFWSPQCGPCMQMKPTVHSLEQANYPIQEVDTTRDSEMSRRFNVSQIPCFVMLVDGQEVDREIGATSSERLQQMFQKAKDVVMQKRRSQPPEQQPPGQIRLQNEDDRLASRTPAVMPAPRLGDQPGAAPATLNAVASSTPRPQPTDGASGFSAPPAATASANGDFSPSLMASTVRIRVEDAQGRSFGTGTIIDSRGGEALVVTCGHLFRESKGKGPMTVEMFDVKGGSLSVADQVPGQLISFDLERDVAFVSIRPNRSVSVAPVAPPKTPIQRGDRVATIGCSNGSDPTLLPQRINMLDRYQGPANIEVSGAPEEGRSGGGLFNLQGQLIGVCYAADYEGKEGLYTALESIHSELNRLGLKDVYAKNDTANPRASDTTIVRGQEPGLAPITPITDSTPRPATAAGSAPPQNLNATEQAAFGEIMQRAATSEVVVIVRPKAAGGQSEVIQLDNVSPEFIRALEAQRKSPAAPATR
jgi:S1-C subfamily serine protease